MVVRIGRGTIVVGLWTLTSGCLTGLGLPPPGTGGQAGSQQNDGMGGGNGGGASGAGGGGGAAGAGGGGNGGGASGAGGGGNGGAAAGGGGEDEGADGGQSLPDGGQGSGGGAGIDALPAPNILDQERWVTQQVPLIDGTKWLAGDFDDDGRTDLAAVFNDQGSASIDVWLSTGSSFTRQRWATQQGGFWATQKWLAGDFDGDGSTDLANVFNDLDQISIDVHRSTDFSGSNRPGFTIERWATRQGGFWDAQKWVAGDFDADRRTDLVNVFEDLGQTSIDLHRSTGSAFVFQRWATRNVVYSETQKWLSGQFELGDSADTLVTVFDDMGSISIDVYLRNGTTLVRSQRGRQLGAFWDAQKWLAGGFSNIGAADLANVFGDNGQASIDIVLDSGALDRRWATQQGGFWDAQQWLAGDFDGDHISDLANVFSDNGSVSIDVHRNPTP